jgi:hypothetical protein
MQIFDLGVASERGMPFTEMLSATRILNFRLLMRSEIGLRFTITLKKPQRGEISVAAGATRGNLPKEIKSPVRAT